MSHELAIKCIDVPGNVTSGNLSIIVAEDIPIECPCDAPASPRVIEKFDHCSLQCCEGNKRGNIAVPPACKAPLIAVSIRESGSTFASTKRPRRLRGLVPVVQFILR